MAKVTNPKKPNNKVGNISIDNVNNYLYKERQLIVDFSFEGSFSSCKIGDYNNCLISPNQFIEKFRFLMKDVKNLSEKTLGYLIENGGYRHCHKVSDEEKALNIIKTVFKNFDKENSYEQEVGGEEIFQLGMQSEIRVIGIIKGNIFRVHFIDYHHDFDYDQKRNIMNKKHCNFCVINSKL